MRRILSGIWRAAVVGLEAFHPRLSGKLATRRFLYTRDYGKMRTAGAPLGASIVPIPGTRHITKAFVWGSEGPLAFLVHGWGGDSGSMRSLVKPLKSRGYRVVAFDAPAHGTNPGNHTTMRDFVASVEYMIDNFEPEREIGAVVGHSLGGLAVIAALSRTIRRPAKLVLVASPSCLNDSLLYYMKTWGFSQGIGKEIRKELDRSHGVPIEHWDVQTLGFASEIPVLIIHDELDALVAPRQADIIAGTLGPSARVVKTRGLGHIRILADEATRELLGVFIGSGEKDPGLTCPKLSRSEICS